MPSVFAPSPLAADKGRYHEPKDGKAGLHPLSDSPPSKGERKEVPSPSKGEGEDGGESRLPLRIDDNGDLILHTADGDICLHKPRIYQEVNGVKQPIPGGYVLLELETQQVGFQVARYDTSKPLIIDPVLSYSTYLGGSGTDEGYSITVDVSGNAYVTGETSSAAFPVAHPLQSSNKGSTDVFVTKLNAAGSALVYSTYLGGSSYDYGYGIAVDSSGNAYVTGFTTSTNFPTTAGVFQTTGYFDAFVTKLNPAGSALVYSTYFGGNGDDYGYGIAVDSSGSAYVTGRTTSSSLPGATKQCSYGVAFVTKLNVAGSAPVYSTCLGDGSASGYGITVDSSDNVYVTGTTNYYNAFVAKFNAGDSTPAYFKLLGGSSTDAGCSIAVDAFGNVYVSGYTYSTDFPTTAGAFQAANGGGYDAFVAKLNATDFALVYSTYLGGSGTDSGLGIAVDSSGNVYVTGGTSSTNFPTVNPIQLFKSGVSSSSDVFVAKLDSLGTALVYSTYLGGSGDENHSSFSPFCIGGIAVDSSGNAYVTGSTYSTNFPTANPFQAANGGGYDAFVAKIVEGGPILSVTPTSLDFGNVTVNSTADKNFTVTNSGGGTLTGSVTTGSPYSIVSGSSFSLGAGASQTVTVRFSPTSTGTFLGNASVSSNGGSASVSLSGTGVDCTYSLSPTSQTFSASSGTGSVSVSMSSGCSWTAVSNASWVTITSGSSGSGNGTVSYSVAANSDASQRTGTLTIAGQTFTVTQAGATCTYSISPTSRSHGSGAETGTVSVTTTPPSGCSWTATSNVSWITITSGSSGSGNGTVGYSVAANSDASQRTGTLTIAGQTFTVTQAGVSCTYSISPTSATVGSSGGTGSVSVTAQSGCSWTATVSSDAATWITITSGSSGSGNGTVSYSVAANDTTSSRTGTMTIVSQTFTVTQSGAVPTLSVSPTSLAFGEVTVGSSSDLSFIVTNIGSGTLTGTATTSSPSFSVASGGSFTLTAGASQTVVVRFSPTSKGAFSGTVSVSSNGGSAVVSLSGTGTEVSNPLLSVSTTTLAFGEVAVNSSKDLTFTVSNAGTGTLTGTVTTTSPFSVTSGGSFSLGTGASQVVTVRFSPTVEGFVSSTAAVSSNGGDASVTLTGTGSTTQNPLLSVTPTSLDFGSVQVGSSSDLTFFVQNSGGETLIGTVSTSAVGFSIVSGSSFTLTAGATQTVTVRFSPPEGGTFSGTVTVSSNGGGESVTVKGVGEPPVEPILTVTPSILDFGFVRVGKSKDLSFTVQNTGEGTLAGTATATDPFSVVTNSSFTLDAGESLLVTVRFSPPTKGPFTGTVEFSSNGGDESATVMGRGWQLPFGLSEEVVPVEIDIQPGGGAVGIDCQEAGVIEVRVFDVRGLSSPIAMETLTLEGSGPPQSWASADADGDEAEDDLVVHFGVEGVRDEACQEGVTLFTLRGELEDGMPIEGWDEVTIVRGR